jgi:hypothetical protein
MVKPDAGHQGEDGFLAGLRQADESNFHKRKLEAESARPAKQIRNPKSETNPKFKSANDKNQRFEHFRIRACFGFRDSDFGFTG